MAYESEIAAVKARIAAVEQTLSDRIKAIQNEAHRSILDEVRRADEDIFQARMFLLSVGANPAASIPTSHQDTSTPRSVKEPTRTKPSSRTASGGSRRKPTARKGRPQSVRSSILHMLVGARDGVLESEIDLAVQAKGLTKDASRKAKGFALKDGAVEIRDGRFHITDAGRQEIERERAAK